MDECMYFLELTELLFEARINQSSLPYSKFDLTCWCVQIFAAFFMGASSRVIFHRSPQLSMSIFHISPVWSSNVRWLIELSGQLVRLRTEPGITVTETNQIGIFAKYSGTFSYHPKHYSLTRLTVIKSEKKLLTPRIGLAVRRGSLCWGDPGPRLLIRLEMVLPCQHLPGENIYNLYRNIS